MSDFRYPRQLRMLTGGDFKRVFDRAVVKVPEKHLLILARPNDLGHARIGFVMSKKNVRRAVQRNRIRRVIRESFRLHQHQLPALDMIILARKGLDELDNPDLHAMIIRCWSRAGKKARKLT
ncbi:MAG: ribonuclease P protein component [Oceanospirillales bacterium]|uniref:Ribonuclease P protein component n=1 Tax=Marinobacterium halophilum TaxID=267374 RepID=A0A2P8EW51_9GAMM|nr:ribonuclease P protein component [Marinobacterium halophilum]MBR9827069.1 ribonuclease P protein component [Oceanospirillales bacterium]PSL13668.1 ribonuclease P protein component [Marinobacterium halophilum]